MTDNKPAILGGTAIKPKEYHGVEAIRRFLYNPDTGQYCTRTPKSWLFIILFYLVYYAFLVGFWSLMLFIFYQTLDMDKPKWITSESLIGTSPGLGMRPEQPEKLIDSSMILFNVDKQADNEYVAGWGGWANRSEKFLSKYENKGKLCSTTDLPREGEACQFPLSRLGPCAAKGHGYDVGKPCVFLKLNRIFGLINDPYNNADDLPEDMPDVLKQHIKTQLDKEQVWIHCQGENPADEEVVDVTYYPPSRGFPAYYFPFEKQEHYESPIVAVQFANLPFGQLVHVECRAWAKNIEYDRRDRLGITHFELYLLNNQHAEVFAKSQS